MPRARSLKPGFFTDAELLECDPWTRLLFAGLWTAADREGRMIDSAKQIKIDVFPADSVDVEPMLAELAERGFIVRYEVAGVRYIQVRNFAKHQNPHRDEKAKGYPAPDQHGANTVQAPGEHAVDTGPTRLTPDSCYLTPESGLLTPENGLLTAERANPSADAHDGRPLSHGPSALSQDQRAGRKTGVPEDFVPSDERLSWTREKGWDEAKIVEEVEAFRAWHKKKRTLSADWDSDWMGWVKRGLEHEADKAKEQAKRAGRPSQPPVEAWFAFGAESGEASR